MKLRFAFAVNHNDQFEKKHFGDADKYIIYELQNDILEYVSEETNLFKALDEEAEHGSKKKGKAIIGLLKDKGVNVLVSMQFGTNIKLINEYFIPVNISLTHPKEVMAVLDKHLHWIADEWERKSSDYKLFTIKSGILKTSIKK